MKWSIEVGPLKEVGEAPEDVYGCCSVTALLSSMTSCKLVLSDAEELTAD